jgi:hypothetical protein
MIESDVRDGFRFYIGDFIYHLRSYRKNILSVKSNELFFIFDESGGKASLRNLLLC